MADTVHTFLNYIDGAWVPCLLGSTFDNLNPADTRDVAGRFQASGPADAEAAVQAAQKAFDGWRRTPIGKRAKILNDAAAYLEQNAVQFAKDLTREEGKQFAQAKDEFLRSAQTFRFYATEGQTYGGEMTKAQRLADSGTAFAPIAS